MGVTNKPYASFFIHSRLLSPECFDLQYADSSLARETWREICVSAADIFHMQILSASKAERLSQSEIVTPTETSLL